MDTLQIFVKQGNLTAELCHQLLKRIVKARRQRLFAPCYFADVTKLLIRIRSFLKNERVLFVQALTRTNADRSILTKINNCANSLNELLDDLVMLHVNEPDGSFLLGLSDLTKEFENLVGLMGRNLAFLIEHGSEISDRQALQVLLPQAA